MWGSRKMDAKRKNNQTKIKQEKKQVTKWAE